MKANYFLGNGRFELREIPLRDIIARGLAAPIKNVRAVVVEGADVVIDALAFGMNILARKIVDQLLHARRMRLVGVLPQIIAQIQQLQLLPFTLCHKTASFLFS